MTRLWIERNSDVLVTGNVRGRSGSESGCRSAHLPPGRFVPMYVCANDRPHVWTRRHPQEHPLQRIRDNSRSVRQQENGAINCRTLAE